MNNAGAGGMVKAMVVVKKRRDKAKMTNTLAQFQVRSAAFGWLLPSTCGLPGLELLCGLFVITIVNGSFSAMTRIICSCLHCQTHVLGSVQVQL